MQLLVKNDILTQEILYMIKEEYFVNSDSIYNLLVQKIPKDNILRNESMKKHTSFKIGGEAEFFVKAKNIEEIKHILSICKNNNRRTKSI